MSEYCPSCMAENADSAEKCSICGGDMHVQNRQHQLPVMTILEGRYLIGKVLGEGGFGITYIGLDLRLEERVAIKEFYPTGSVTRYAKHSEAVEATSAEGEILLEREREKFLNEARTMSRFSGESSIVHVKDFFYANSTAYIVMEFIDGETMQQRLKEKGPENDFNKLLDMLRPVIKDLDDVHRAGFIHRDISPSNLMVDKSGSVKLLDFGTAREVNEDGEKSLSIMLKPGFAPEEQYRRRGQQGPWTDVYALCATIYKLCTGVTPEVSVDRLSDDSLEPPSKLGVKINPQQEAVLARGLAVHQEDRIQSVAELLEELDKAAKGKAVLKPERIDKPKADKRKEPRKPKKGQIVLAAIAAVLVIGITAVFATGAAQDGIGLVNDFLGNSAEAVKWYTLAADRGFADAQNNLGVCYENGNGVAKSYAEAVKWYKLAAEQGDSDAQVNLGLCYENGNGVKQSFEEAVKWYQLAAEQGNAYGQGNLGLCYDLGLGVKQDYDKAVKWYRLAAEKGNADAQNNLGTCYRDGTGVERSDEEAARWFRLSADQGNAYGQGNLGWCYEYGCGVEQSYEEAAKWYKLAADQGDSAAQNNLGWCYENGNGVEKNYKEAVKWYRLAAEQGDSNAQFNLGCCYENGIGTEQNYEEAVKWYRLAAEQGDSAAQNNLGVCYCNGNGVEQSYIEAVKWYRLAADQGESAAQNNLGACYCNGNGVEQSYIEAVKWFKLAAEQGDSNAQYNIGRCYEYGNGVEQSYEEAAKWYQLAADSGDEDAQERLDTLRNNGLV